MSKKFCFLFLIMLSSILVGCTSEGDTLLIKKDFNTFNSYFASGLSCYGYTGLSLTGSSGSVNRQLNVTNFPLIIVVDTFYLNNGYDYNFTGVNTTYVITFKNAVWNDQEIGICLATSNTTWSNSVYLGANCTGSDGGLNRVLVSNITSPFLVAVDNQLLSSGFDYTLLGSNVTFINNLWDDMVISIWG